MNKPLHKTETMPPGWAALEERLRSAEMVAPRAGFARRWQARWRAAGAETPQVSRAQAAGLLAASGLLTLALFVLLLALLPPLDALQPGGLLADALRYLSVLGVASRVLVTTLSSFLAQVPNVVWIVMNTSALAALVLTVLLLDRKHVRKETK
ncbi:MAG: hypothetical protein KIT08_00270 [Anaerolineales bacterium]|nr:MAG: hypothetical protein KIT08_00270 [Anaerolineales bacterium]